MAGLNFLHAVAQAWEAGKLFHIDLNDQNSAASTRTSASARQNLKQAFFLVKFLEDVRLPAARATSTPTPTAPRTCEGVKDFARGCMRTYLILKDKARRWNADAEIQALLAEIRHDEGSAAGPLGATPREGRGARGSLRPRGAGGARPRLREARPAHHGSAAGRALMDTVHDLASFAAAVRPLVSILRELRLDDAAAAQRILDERAPLSGPLVQGIRTAAEAGAQAGWLLPKEAHGIRFGRVAKDLDGFSVDAVRSAGGAGRHRHPEGEVDLLFATSGTPRFDGHAEGWAVYPPGSEHVPGVSGGEMLILYFLPHGKIEWL